MTDGGHHKGTNGDPDNGDDEGDGIQVFRVGAVNTLGNHMLEEPGDGLFNIMLVEVSGGVNGIAERSEELSGGRNLGIGIDGIEGLFNGNIILIGLGIDGFYL